MSRSFLLAAVVPFVFSAQAGPHGTWVGSGTLTNNWVDAGDPKIALQCVYVGKGQPPSITLSLPSTATLGQLILEIPSPNASCPPLRKRYQIRPEITGTRVTFTDPAGDRWSLTLTTDLLIGDVAWRASEENPNEALFVGGGFAYQPPLRPWDVPFTRLSGKVTLRRAAGASRPR